MFDVVPTLLKPVDLISCTNCRAFAGFGPSLVTVLTTFAVPAVAPMAAVCLSARSARGPNQLETVLLLFVHDGSSASDPTVAVAENATPAVPVIVATSEIDAPLLMDRRVQVITAIV